MPQLDELSLSEHDHLCSTPNDLLDSRHFETVLRIYNRHTAEKTVSKKTVTKQDVLDNRNIRNQLNHFFSQLLQVRVVGMEQASMLVWIAEFVEKVRVILDERNKKIGKQEIEKGSLDDQKMLGQRIYVQEQSSFKTRINP